MDKIKIVAYTASESLVFLGESWILAK